MSLQDRSRGLPVPVRFKRHSYGLTARLVHAAATLLLLFVAAGPALAETRLVVAYGDSLMAGYGLKPGEGFAPQLERALKARGHDVRVVSASVSGDTTAAGKQRLAWVMTGLKTRPDLVILGLGANDMLRGLPPAAARQNLDAMISALKARGSGVLIAGMLATPNLGKAYGNAFNSMYPALARKHAVPLYPFFMRGVAARKLLLLADGMHPNATGVQVIVRSILPSVEAAL
jgi:acyl-CoA thioesterase-1